MSPKSIIYKKIGQELKRQGFNYKLIERKKNVAIYEQRHKQPGISVSYEVVKIGRHNGFSIAGKDFPPAETYPTTSTWGSRGWTYQELSSARAKMRFLLAASKDIEGIEEPEIINDESILAEMIQEEENGDGIENSDN